MWPYAATFNFRTRRLFLEFHVHGARTYTSRPNAFAWRKAFLISRLQIKEAPKDINCECGDLRPAQLASSTLPCRSEYLPLRVLHRHIFGSWYPVATKRAFSVFLPSPFWAARSEYQPHPWPQRPFAQVNGILAVSMHPAPSPSPFSQGQHMPFLPPVSVLVSKLLRASATRADNAGPRPSKTHDAP